jgi:hypothetical protein
MGTRAVFTFVDAYDKFSVYKHWDGYEEGACIFLVNAIPFSWGMNRYEACDFAAAFIAANKKSGGDVYFSKGPEDHGDLEYKYELTKAENGQFIIRATHIAYEKVEDIFYGRLKDFVNKYGSSECKTEWNELDNSENKLEV